MEETAQAKGAGTSQAAQDSQETIEPSTDPAKELKTISIQDNLLIKLPSGKINQVTNLYAKPWINLGKYGRFELSGILGDPFGLTYEIQEDGKLLKGFQGQEDGSGHEHPIPLDYHQVTPSVEDIEANNQFIKESIGAQGLSFDEIEDLKRSGLSGREIIQRQIEQHSAFELKSEFSKAKYIKRKEKKFLKSFTCLDPSVYNVNQYLFENYFHSIKGLRPDTLSQILNLSNVRPGWKGIVIDDCGGFVVGAVLTRMAGEGTVYVVTDSDSPPDLHLLAHLNLSPLQLRPLQSLNWLQIQCDYQNLELEQLKSKLASLTNSLPSNQPGSSRQDTKAEGESSDLRSAQRERYKLRKKMEKCLHLEALRAEYFKTPIEAF